MIPILDPSRISITMRSYCFYLDKTQTPWTKNVDFIWWATSWNVRTGYSTSKFNFDKESSNFSQHVPVDCRVHIQEKPRMVQTIQRTHALAKLKRISNRHSVLLINMKVFLCFVIIISLFRFYFYRIVLSGHHEQKLFKIVNRSYLVVSVMPSLQMYDMSHQRWTSLVDNSKPQN